MVKMVKFSISEKEFPSKHYQKFASWYGEYEVLEITANELMEIDEEIAGEQIKKGIPIAERTFDIVEYNKHFIAKTCMKDGKNLTIKQIMQLPAKLYQLLYMKAQELNLITDSERRFLLNE